MSDYDKYHNLALLINSVLNIVFCAKVRALTLWN